jgi:O-antigen ligase
MTASFKQRLKADRLFLELGRIAKSMRAVRPITRLTCFVLVYGLPLVLLADWLFDFEYVGIPFGLVVRAVILALLLVFVPLTGLSFRSGGFIAGGPLALILGVSVVYAVWSENWAQNIYHVARMAFWILVAVAAFRLRVMRVLTDVDLARSVALTVLVGAAFTIYLMSRPDTDPGRNASAYLLLWCMPLLLYLNKIRLRWLLVVVSVVAIVFTIKRGAIVALIFSSLIYVALYARLNLTLGGVLKTLGVLGGLMGVVGIALSHRWDLVVSRFQDTSGSGRDVLYDLVWGRWLDAWESNPINFLLGYGINSVQNYTALFYEIHGDIGPYAHSDVIQFAHDFGVLGLVSLALLHVAHIRVLLAGTRQRHANAPALAMGYVILLLVNAYSGHLTSPTAVYYGLLVACCSADLRRSALGLDIRS